MSESKDCHMSNNDILSNCLIIISNGTKKSHRPSSHGDAYFINRNRIEAKEMAIIHAEVDSVVYFDELLNGVNYG